VALGDREPERGADPPGGRALERRRADPAARRDRSGRRDPNNNRRRLRGSGIELEQDVGWVFRIRDGKMLRLHTYLDREEALAAGGIS
jgi:ketosteroid isomerase-like protein